MTPEVCSAAAFSVADVSPPDELGDLWTWRGRRYLLRGVAVDDYRQRQRVRSPRWGTVSLLSAVFREVARPFRYFTRDYHPQAEECPF